jgi:hypothetical protein
VNRDQEDFKEMDANLKKRIQEVTSYKAGQSGKRRGQP